MPTAQAASVQVGLDSAVAARLGYHHRLTLGGWPHGLQLRARLAVPVATPDLADTRAEVGAQAALVQWRALWLLAELDGVLLNTRNAAFAANALGLRAALLPGYRGGRWGLLADLAYEATLAAHLRPSDRYRRKVYPQARDGWYGHPGGTWQLGVRAGVRLGPVELAARLGWMITEQGAPHLPPFFGTLGLAHAF
ncbi:MAG: hypothetical protein H6702_14830 [Myxococcales bacterium]|nr:hypothetical protein [Myxococcales bacterium]